MSFPPGVEAFLGELRADQRTAAQAEVLAQALHALDLEGDCVPEAAGLLQVIDEVLLRAASLTEKVEALDRLMEADRIILTRRYVT